MKIYNLNFLIFLIINPLDETLSVDNNLRIKNGKIRPSFAEIFGQKWENEKKEGNETDQNLNYEQNAIDSDQNTDQMENQQKCEIVHKFHTIKERIKKKGKFPEKIWKKIEQKICKNFGIGRTKIYKWKKEFGLSRKTEKKNYYAKKKKEFIERIDEIKTMYKKGKQKQIAKELGISEMTLSKWKREFGIEMRKKGKRYSNEEKTNKMSIYYKMKKDNSSLSDTEIARSLKISLPNLSKWKNQKLSKLSAHVVPFARSHLWWGLISEQGMEHMHRMCNNLVGRNSHLGTQEKIVEKLVKHTTMLNALHDRGVENNKETTNTQIFDHIFTSLFFTLIFRKI